jgi:hypothetical protein
MAKTLLLVTGSGRSGTSSLAGSLEKLGLHLPGPVVPPGPINPKGFFENVWVVDFHRDLLREALVRSSDGSPDAAQRVHRVLADESAARRLREWMDRHDEHDLLVVKDNQACWFLPLWEQVTAECGRDLRLLTSLRHPAEVVGSRDRAWGSDRGEAESRMRETANVAAWVNVLLVTEEAGRRVRRSFVRFEDLIGDWRTELARISDQLGLGLVVPPPGEAHELDEWLDAELRTALTWDDIDVPAALRGVAEDTWAASTRLVAAPDDPGLLAELDECHRRYTRLYAEAAAISIDERRHAKKLGARTASAKLRARFRAREAKRQEAEREDRAFLGRRRGR